MEKFSTQKILHHFLFILPSRFPTEKAYGVTTEHSARAVVGQGFKATIVTPFLDENFPTRNEINQIGFNFARFLLSNRLLKCISLRFNTFLVLFSILIRLRYKSENYIYWTRDINLALLLSLFSKNKVICEVHRTPIKIQLFILKILSRKKNVLLAPISNFLDNTSLYNKKRKIIAPMAVNSSDIEYFNKIRKKRRRNIIYVGNIESGGIKLDLSILISVAKLLKESNLDWSIEVVGISTTQAMQASKFKNLENLRFLGYLPRESVLQKLRSSRIGVVMYPNLPWFYDSFPIKIVEYSAAGLAIVASDTISHRRVLDEKRCLYFEANSAASLYGAILELTKNNVLEKELSNNSRIWASNFTYEKRVKLVINAVLNLGTKNN